MADAGKLNPAHVTVTVPDLGDVHDAVIIDLLVRVGDKVAVDTPLVTLESEKATVDLPSTAAGVVMQILVKAGDKVSLGTPILTVQPESSEDPSVIATDTRGKVRAAEPYGGEPYVDTVPIAPVTDPRASRRQPAAATGAPAAAAAPIGDTAAPAKDPVTPPSPAKSAGTSSSTSSTSSATSVAPQPSVDTRYDFDVAVLGAGPGGYTAAFRAADLGLRVALIERSPVLGGVCLNVGCIPSKALLHAAKVIDESSAMRAHGIDFGEPRIDAAKLRKWKEGVVARLNGGLAAMAKQRKVSVFNGNGRFAGPHSIEVSGGGPNRAVSFAHCIIAAGSESLRLPGWPDDPRIIDSTGALELDLPQRMLVVGGGIIGLEIATVYAALGVKVSVVELTPTLMPGCDTDLVRPLQKRIAARYENIWLATKVTQVSSEAKGLRVTFDGANAPEPQLFDRVLVAVGRTPNGRTIAAETAGVHVNERGFIPVDRQMRTNVPHIFAIGDVVGQPMLAHKATHEGKVAAEVAAGHKTSFDARVIPSVAYTDPEVAWVGVTETSAKADGVVYERAAFPWAASGRALAIGRDEGFTKLLFDPSTHRVIGGGIVGPGAGDLISEVALAIEMGCDAADIGLTIHPHPTLSETVAMAAEAFEGTLTDLYMPKKKR
jgi:dihydrolipoyl dehydrogenase